MKFAYFVSFSHPTGFGNTGMLLNAEIKSMEQIRALEANIVQNSIHLKVKIIQYIRLPDDDEPDTDIPE